MADGAQTPPTQTVGPDFRSQNQNPSATVSVEVPFENVHILPQTPQLIALLSYVFCLLFYVRPAEIGQKDSK